MIHTTTKVATKTAELDVRIVELVRWMNLRRDVYTIYSCEGGPQEPGVALKDATYVLFHCWNPAIIEFLRKTVAPFGFAVTERRRAIGRRRVHCFNLTGVPWETDLDGLTAALPAWPEQFEECR